MSILGTNHNWDRHLQSLCLNPIPNIESKTNSEHEHLKLEAHKQYGFSPCPLPDHFSFIFSVFACPLKTRVRFSLWKVLPSVPGCFFCVSTFLTFSFMIFCFFFLISSFINRNFVSLISFSFPNKQNTYFCHWSI